MKKVNMISTLARGAIYKWERIFLSAPDVEVN